MLTDQELIEGLRRELAAIEPPEDLLERLRRAQPHEPPAVKDGRSLAWRRSGSALLAGTSVLVVLVVAVGGLVLVGHRADTGGRAAHALARPAARPVSPTLADIKANFAVLRRPQTSADRSARSGCGHPCPGRLVAGLTRLARTLPGGTRVFVAVWQMRVSEAGAAAGSYVLTEAVIPEGRPALLMSPESLATPRFVRGWSVSGIPQKGLAAAGSSLWSAIIPDGVTHVRWTFVCLQPRPCAGTQRGPVTVAARVVDNVAAVRVPPVNGGERGVRYAAWFAHDGREVAQFDTLHHATASLASQGQPAVSGATAAARSTPSAGSAPLRIQATYTSAGLPLLIVNADVGTHRPVWSICPPAPGAACVPQPGQAHVPGSQHAQFLRSGPEPAGTIFKATITADGQHYSAQTAPWQGPLRTVAAPRLSGRPAAGQTVTPIPARWSGGWGQDLDALGVQACPSAEQVRCVTLSRQFPGDHPGRRRARIAPRFTGWYLFAIDERFARETAWALPGYRNPQAIPALAPGGTVAISAPVGPIRAEPSAR